MTTIKKEFKRCTHELLAIFFSTVVIYGLGFLFIFYSIPAIILFDSMLKCFLYVFFTIVIVVPGFVLLINAFGIGDHTVIQVYPDSLVIYWNECIMTMSREFYMASSANKIYVHDDKWNAVTLHKMKGLEEFLESIKKQPEGSTN